MTTISSINMKGGVGKTTSVVEIATLLATEHDNKVLVIDLDPQNKRDPFTNYNRRMGKNKRQAAQPTSSYNQWRNAVQV